MHKNNGCNHGCDESLLKELEALPDDWRFTPVDGNKAPYLKDWQTKHLTKKELEKHINFDNWCRAIGLLCGTPSGGLLLLDLDGESCNEYFPKLFDVPVGDLPDTVSVTSGRPGRCQRIYKVPQQYWNSIKSKEFKTGVKGDDGKDEQIELRWNGRQSVVAGEHPMTGSYKWLPGKSPNEIGVAEAPTYLIEKMLIPTPAKSAARSTYHYRGDTTSEADKARSYLAALALWRADDYYDWLHVGMALHSVGDDSLLDDWDKWSQQSESYESGCCEQKWHSFRGSGYTIASLCYWAKQDGWKSSKEFDKQVNKGAGKNMSESEVFKQEITEILNEKDPEERERLKAIFVAKHRVSYQKLENLLAERRNQQSASKYKTELLSLNDILQRETTGVDWLFTGLLPRGETALLLGCPKVGKTIFAYNAAFAVVTGSDFLGEKVQQGKVLVIQTDESQNSMARKFHKIGFTGDHNEFIKIVTDFSITNLPLLENWLNDFKPDLVIIDSLTRINMGLEVNENETKFAESIYKVRELLQKHNTACLLLHHDKKSDEATGVNKVRGSSAIAGAVWGNIFLEHIKVPSKLRKGSFVVDPSDLNRTLALHGVRDCEGLSLHLELNPENLSWLNHGEVGISQEEVESRKSMRERLLNLLTTNQDSWLSGMEIAELLGIATDTERKTMYRVLGRMEDVYKQVVTKPNPRKLSSSLYRLSPLNRESKVSTNFNQSYTHQPLQNVDSNFTSVYKKNDTQDSVAILTTNGNEDQVKGSAKFVDSSSTGEGGSVPAEETREKPVTSMGKFRIGDWVKVNREGHELSGQRLKVIEIEDENSDGLAILHLETSPPVVKKHWLYAHQVKRLPRIT